MENPAFFEDPAFEDPTFEDPIGGAPVAEAPATVPGQDLVEPPPIVGEPTDIQVTDPAAETGAGDTVAIDQPTVVEGDSPAVETGVEDAVTPTSAADADDIDPTSLRKFLDFIGRLVDESVQSESATPVEPPVEVKRWVKERY